MSDFAALAAKAASATEDKPVAVGATPEEEEEGGDDGPAPEVGLSRKYIFFLCIFKI